MQDVLADIAFDDIRSCNLSSSNTRVKSAYRNEKN